MHNGLNKETERFVPSPCSPVETAEGLQNTRMRRILYSVSTRRTDNAICWALQGENFDEFCVYAR